MTSALHSSATQEWYTPAEIVDAARFTMGHIDVDPATCAEAQQTILAGMYYTADQDGLRYYWHGNVFLNPPSGLVREFWEKAMLEWQYSRLKQLIYVGFSLEQLQTLQNSSAVLSPIYFPICIPRKRLVFIPGRAEDQKKTDPTHGNFITYIGPNRDKFFQNFSKFGYVVVR